MSENIEQLWNTTCTHLQKLLNKDVYERWVLVARPYKIEDNTYILTVDNDFYQTWLNENYLDIIQDALSLASGKNYTVRFDVSSKTDSADQKLEKEKKKLTIKLPTKKNKVNKLKTGINDSLKFDNFIVGNSNNFAHAACMGVANAPGKAYNPLFIYGGVGLGKTHLMHGIGNYIKENDARSKIYYTSSEEFLNEYIKSIQTNTTSDFRKKYRSIDILLIDDIQFLAGRERIQEEFFHTFNTLHHSNKQIVLTSDRPASEIKGLEDRLVSRFEWGLTTELQMPDIETRIAILRNKQANSDPKVSNEIITFIAENITSNVRRLEGALIKVITFQSFTHAQLTISDVEKLLKDVIDKESTVDVNFGTIQKIVAEFFDIRLADMTSTKRPRSIAIPRQIAMYLCRNLTRASLPEIGNAFGKTHATIIHACKTVENLIENDDSIRKSVIQIKEKLSK
jgi:chromosomal replication initiator protein